MRSASPSYRPPLHLVPPLLTLLLLFHPLKVRAEAHDPTDKRRQRASEFEKRGAWLEACRAWDDVLRRDRQSGPARDGYQRCLRRLQLQMRHSDQAYQQALMRLAPPQALEVYEQVVTLLHVAYPDRSRVGFTQLFRQGLHELKLALEDAVFRRLYLPGAKNAALSAFKSRLAAWPDRPLGSRHEAREQALEVLRGAGRAGLSLRPAAISAMVMELAAGACNTLDDHSAFLSPGNLALVQAALRGKLVGVGVEVGLDDEDRLYITRVYHKGPAEDAGLEVGDRIVRIGGVATAYLPPDIAAERLRGDPGSAIEIEVERKYQDNRAVRLVRRAVHMPSVETFRLTPLDDGSPGGLAVGIIRIHHFQDSTLQEVKEAILELSSSAEPVKGLILDLRGNPGGVFKAAVSVAELFVSGVIVVGQSPFKEYNRPFKSESGGPINLPMVVLIDGETASAAEVLAGALQGGRPGTKLLGQTSYGKGSIQCIIPMDKSPLDGLAGIRLTVAKLFSPTNQPYTGRGVTPDVVSAERGEGLVAEARKLLLELLRPGLAPPMPRVVAMDVIPNPS